MATNTFSRKSKELLVITLLLNLAAAGWYGFLFYEVKQKNERISNLVNEIEVRSAEENMQGSIKTLVAETEPLREKLSNYFVGKEGAVTFIELLEQAGRDVGASVTIEAVSPVELPSVSFAETLRFTIKATGTWSSVTRFLGLMEFLPYEAQIQQVVISRSALAGEGWRLDFTLRVLQEK
ncbi:MAG: hypothetical protein EXS51_02955 [Candidatus Taylorbacteria bacterium]|nr:hypothetical protein [Candidatus Taylorbacteria bacterium]